MADIFDKETRRRIMSRIRGKDTKPEMIVRSFLFSQGFRFRLHSKELPGRPDIVLPKFKTIVLVNGCFWHGHEGCDKFKIPRSNSEYWIKKIESNRDRDRENSELLKSNGWKIITLWECQLRNHTSRKARLTELVEQIKISMHNPSENIL